MTWAEAVEWYRQQPGHEQAVLDNYFDREPLMAAQRFLASAEFAATRELLPPAPAMLLEIGAGTGMASYAFAKAGYAVTALEPDSSDQVGASAIAALAREGGVEITLAQQAAAILPGADASYDIVYARQVLHHVPDLAQLGREIARVLKPGGVFLAVRDHVIRSADDLPIFLQRHPLHHLYGGENALVREGYVQPMQAAGLTLEQSFGPFDSPINLHPMRAEELPRTAYWWKVNQLGLQGLLRGVAGYLQPLITVACSGPLVRQLKAGYYEPGHLFSFLFRKPHA